MSKHRAMPRLDFGFWILGFPAGGNLLSEAIQIDKPACPLNKKPSTNSNGDNRNEAKSNSSHQPRQVKFSTLKDFT